MDPIVDGHGAGRIEPDRGAAPSPELKACVDALRELIDNVVRTEASTDELGEIADALGALAARLRERTPEWAPSVPATIASTRNPHVYFPFSPQIGQYNPLAPPVELVVADDATVTGRAHLGAAYEGPPGCVHGGMIASIFDELLGVANISTRNPAMTGTLTIRYRSPTPLQTDLELAARTTGRDGRKIYASGEITAGGRLCAEAEGIFVEVNPMRFVPEARSEN
jgi:acyl-coenzyme A thioesterase PaaI-like protein